MSENKLSCEQVPAKFSEWLLAMGCPSEKVPTLDKVAEMCRGQYYMVWRSLMEHVEIKDVVRQKRLQVFCDDMHKWIKKNNDTNITIPEELFLWHQHNDVKEKVYNAELRIKRAQNNLKQLMDNISTKLSHRNLSQQHVKDIQRRIWLLQQVSEELKAKKENLEETRTIANSLCLVNEDVDVQSKLDKYVSLLRRPSQLPTNSGFIVNPIASSSVVSTNGDVSDIEDQLSWVMKCRSEALWPQLCERRAGLVAALMKDAAGAKAADNVGITPQKVLSHTAALHCSLALEAMKNKMHIKQTQKRLEAAISELNNYLTGEACELLVVRCERARTTARVNTLRTLLSEVTSRAGIFCAGDETSTDPRATTRQIASIDKSIETKKEELKRLLTSLPITEKKIQNVRECLVTLFNGFQKNLPLHDQEKYRGQVDFPQESIATLRQFYDERRETRKNRLQLSLDLDASDSQSYNDTAADFTNPKFADELKAYLQTFSLEKNRKLVLESGEKIWIFETLHAAVNRLHMRCVKDDLTCSLVCPSISLSSNLNTVINSVKNREQLEFTLKAIENGVMKRNANIDLSLKSEEDNVIDKIKKRLNENIQNLQKTNKTLDLGQENLKFWSDNLLKKHISVKRLVNGKTFHDYEAIYKENISF